MNKMSELNESKVQKSEMDIKNSNEVEVSSKHQQKSVFTVASSVSKEPKPAFNIEAAPFVPNEAFKSSKNNNNNTKIKIGPSEIEVNSNIWGAIASNRPLPILPRMPQLSIAPTPPPPVFLDFPMTSSIGPFNASACAYSGYNNPPLFENDYSRSLMFQRNYGPVANYQGYVEFRLHEDITIFISLDRSILLRNPRAKVTIAVSSDGKSAAIEHPNGKVYQSNNNIIDMIVYDGTKKSNNFIRYAKMWEKGISLTAEGCALIYLVDNAGSRTTSDAVNKDLNTDYCSKVFFESGNIGPHLMHEVEMACNSYQYLTQKDGSHVFEILGVRISQTLDGMVQVSRPNNRLKIHTSPSNGSARLSTPSIHSTASMGKSSHLFVRYEERRMHFDGTSIVVRNQGHSAGFDEDNNLRIY